ncbi:class I SAM-dependent methyltransferase [Kitasatospora aureofaciens]|uniref:class I SAM-dependent methyltransferase n=1 Tax=Kitasatospora aureofaciens TaxID=1894 RepID=UPI00068DE262|nr:class I SAM-dependent methyltransferase [Kitasatospora aureofaciens]HJD82359.1 class I SAM-dependent methyltransferase [Kitasatospora aureofaciens]
MPSEAIVAARPVPQKRDDIPGWFFGLDRAAFSHLLSAQTAAGITGDVLELGSYLGRSAVLLGDHLQPGERLTVCDLFDSEAGDAENAAEMTMSYRKTLTRSAFESNYLAFHSELPEIVQAPTSVLADGRIPADSCRFVHVDASHLYEHVSGDILVARSALAEDGLVALDDYRSEHTPGVSAAVWEAVFTGGLRPVLLTPMKFYGTWGDAAAARRTLLARDWRAEGYTVDEDTIAGHHVLRLNYQVKTPAQIQRSTPRRLALDLLPPVATRATRRVLRTLRERRAVPPTPGA